VHLDSMGVVPSRALEGIGILTAFRARDGWFTVEVVREPHFVRLAEAVGHEEWLTDDRFANRVDWSRHLDAVIRPAVEAWAATRSKRDAAAELAGRGVVAGPVNDAADIRADPHVRARRLVHQVHAADGHTVAVVGNPIDFGGSAGDGGEPAPWPLLGADTDRVLSDRLGLTLEELSDLRARGVVA
jgi:crotonobetainyl-CoA:carnitine CoA-transferase CaiB-like acyl-CoA transferase